MIIFYITFSIVFNVLFAQKKNTDFSLLSDTPNEKVEAEKIKIYEEIIHKCK